MWGYRPVAFSTVNRSCVGLLCGGAGRLTAKNGLPARADGESGALRPHAECMVPIGNAARHLAVHRDGKHVSTASLYLVTPLLAEGSAQIYVDEEAGAMVTAHDFDAAARLRRGYFVILPPLFSFVCRIPVVTRNFSEK